MPHWLRAGGYTVHAMTAWKAFSTENKDQR
jgi:hypothetical protein